MSDINAAMNQLDEDEAKRVLRWALDKFGHAEQALPDTPERPADDGPAPSGDATFMELSAWSI